MDLAALRDELDRLGIHGNVDLNSGQTVNDGGFTIRYADDLWHVRYFERGITEELMTPTPDEDAACRELLRNLRAFSGR